MKTTIVRLDAHDDHVTVRDKLAWVKSGRVVLLWPRRNGPDFRLLDWQMIRHAARRSGVQVAVVARQGHVRRDVARVGLPAFERLEDAQGSLWPQAESRQHRSRRKTLRWLRAQRPQARELPLLLRFFWFFLGWAAVLLMVGVLLPSATVSLAFRSEVRTLPLNLALHEVETGTLRVVLDGQRVESVSGLQPVPQEPAAGEVLLTNISSSPLDVPRGTVLRPAGEGPAFETLAFRHLEPGEQVSVPVQALVAGSAGNLPAETIWVVAGNLGASLRAENPAPLTGGSEAMMRSPSEAERQALWSRLLADLQKQALAQLADQAQPDGVLLPGTLRLAKVYEQILLPEPGQPGEQMAAYGRMAFEADYVRLTPLRARLQAALELPDGWVVDWDLIQGEARLLPDEEKVTLTLQVTVRPQPATSDLVRLLQGRTPEEARLQLQSVYPLAASPEIAVQPAFWPWLPWWPARLQISY